MRRWGIVPAAGAGSRIQPLAFSKELLPVGSRVEGGAERPRAVSEYLLERMVTAGADRICVVISPGKSDIVEYFGAEAMGAQLFYAVQPEPVGLCDALFRALPLVRPEDRALVGLPDTVWFPDDGFVALDERHALSFLCFPVEHPELFDAVVADADGRVREVQVKRQDATSHWVWGAFALSGLAFAQLHALWLRRDRRDEYLGTLVNAWLGEGGEARAVCAGETYVDVGTLHGYRAAIRALEERASRRVAEWRERTGSALAHDPRALDGGRE